MKTREKILMTSLALFNEEGEPNVTTVDIAAELDISPGNLYYHFKGKGLIIKELYERFESELIELLNAPLDVLRGDDSLIYFFVLFEQIYAFRFFYQHQRDIIQRVPELESRYKKLLKRKHNNAIALLEHLQSQEAINLTDEEKSELSENIVLIQTYWLSYISLRDIQVDEKLALHRGVGQIIALVAPFLTPKFRPMYDNFRQAYRVKLGKAPS